MGPRNSAGTFSTAVFKNPTAPNPLTLFGGLAMRCVSCNKEVTNDYVRFKCPGCKRELVRCNHCREIAATYKCPHCGFEGP
jgi:predicted RNA-binding Zn-ribbon protein involved in translation (DUF1610 family)